MADLSHAERSRNALDASLPNYSRADQVRAKSAWMIGNVIKAHRGKPAIEVYLAIGSVCPFSAKYDCAIWIEELNRLMDDRAKPEAA